MISSFLFPRKHLHFCEPKREARCYPPEKESRVIRDVQDCCRHFPCLLPQLERYMFDLHQPMRLVLNGTIPVNYKGSRYQIPVMIWCQPHYPNEAPIPYVRPTADMVLRERHPNLARDGRVYLPHYLSIWDSTQYSLYGLVLAMIRVFSVEPPVHSRPTAHSKPSDEYERRNLISTLSERATKRLKEAGDDATAELGLLMDRKDSALSKRNTAKEQVQKALTDREAATDIWEQLSSRKNQLETWAHDVSETRASEDPHVDDILHYSDMTYHQIAENLAKDHAYTDTMDQVDEAFVRGLIDHETYIKDVRKLGREQFFPRALAIQLRNANEMRSKEASAKLTPANSN